MKINGKYKVLVILLAAILPVLHTAVTYAQGNVSDGATVTVDLNVDPLDKYRGAKELTQLELVDLLSQVGFEGRALKIAWAIAMKESNGRPLAHNDDAATGDNSYGLFQINMLGYLGEDRREKFGVKKNSELFDPVVNAEAAFYMSARGTNFGSWGWGPDAYDGDPAEPKISRWLDKFPG